MIRDGRPLLQDSVFATRIAPAEIDFIALEITNLRVIWGSWRARIFPTQ